LMGIDNVNDHTWVHGHYPFANVYGRLHMTPTTRSPGNDYPMFDHGLFCEQTMKRDKAIVDRTVHQNVSEHSTYSHNDEYLHPRSSARESVNYKAWSHWKKRNTLREKKYQAGNPLIPEEYCNPIVTFCKATHPVAKPAWNPTFERFVAPEENNTSSAFSNATSHEDQQRIMNGE
jgi:hypothetical protein